MKYNLLLLLLLSACVPLTQTSTDSNGNPKVLQLMDMAYEPQIKTVQLHPSGGSNSSMWPAVTQLGEWNLVLEFDDLRNQRDNYYARLIHCNHDWTKSTLMDLDFMNDYNEVNLTNYQFSIDTHLPYVHYTYNLPAVKLPGNYVIVVYRNGDKDDIVLSRRFMVYENQISFMKDGNLITSGKAAKLNQQINFTISYKDIEIPNPLENVWVVIRQNQRWDNMATDIKPTFVRDFEHELEYHFFDDKKLFKAGNEFRFFDLRSLNYPGRNIGSVDKKNKPFEVYIQPDQPRSQDVYSQYKDLDGNYYVSNLDYSDPNFTNYVNVTFTLQSPKINGDVYLIGGFEYWNQNKENRMRYDSAQNVYTSRMLLKQGWYDYQYAVKSPTLPPYYYEGTYFETENTYEIFVYYKAYQYRAEHLIGYIQLNENPR